jgi:hypothetical protein
MSIEMDAGARVPGAPFNAADLEVETAAAEAEPLEGRLILATLGGVLAASFLGVLVFLG